MNERGKPLVLVVNDDDIGRYAISRTLKQAQFEVTEAATGAEGLELATEQPDLILLDVNLPDINGMEVCRRLKADPDVQQIPVLHLSATFVDDESYVAGLESGADGYLTYPLEPPVLIATIRAHLRIRESEAERERLVEELRVLNEELERRVSARTAELLATNRTLASRTDELEALAYSISHDLRSPLRGVNGFSQVLLEDYAHLLDDEARDYLRRIKAGAELMGEQIDHLLQLSRLSRRELKSQDVDLSELARAVAAELQAEAPERSIEFSAEGGLTVVGDKALLTTLLHHLLENAFKFTGPCAHPRIEFGSREKDGETVYYVRDNGIGFKMEYSGRLFTAFQTLHPNRELSGSGIGLATVRRIVHRHGGNVWGESEPGVGSVFSFTLPEPAHSEELDPPEKSGNT